MAGAATTVTPDKVRPKSNDIRISILFSLMAS
jgi:hypothetical protein